MKAALKVGSCDVFVFLRFLPFSMFETDNMRN